MVMHTLARLTGFGMIVTPRAPFRLDRADTGSATSLRVAGPNGEVVVDAARLGDEPDAQVPLDVVPGPERGQDWWIETTIARCRWPSGFGLSSDPEGRSPFLLLGPREMMVWIDGLVARSKATPIEKLVAPGHVVRAVAQAEASARIDIDYEHDGEPWWQRRYAIEWGRDHLLLVVGQARVVHEDVVRAAVDLLEQTLEPPAEAPSAAS